MSEDYSDDFIGDGSDVELNEDAFEEDLTDEELTELEKEDADIITPKKKKAVVSEDGEKADADADDYDDEDYD